jgi:2,4-dienoyl-CoA reductase-like NADH-dependent reductase (Old Yellow Enzyme family)
MDDVIFEPLEFRNLTVKNRLFRSSISGRFDNYDGSGTPIRANWDEKFARGGIGAIISSNAPVHPRGLIVPNYAYIDDDDKIPFWRELGRRAHEHGSSYICQIAFSGRQRDYGGIQYAKGWSSTDKPEPIHGLPGERMSREDIRLVVECFGQAARRVKEAGLDGVEVHGCCGYLITQFLSPAINDREDEYGGSLENRARFPLEIVRAIRAEVGDDFHLQFKLSVVDDNDAVFPWAAKGTTLEDSVQLCRWLEAEGVDAFHVTAGGYFPHPRNPAGGFPIADVVKNFDALISSGRHTFRNYLMFRTPPINLLFKKRWEQPTHGGVEGINLPLSRAIKQAVGVPVLVAGGWQTASRIREAVESGGCDGVTLGRPLIANPDLPKLFAEGHDRAPRPCTYCNKCLINFVENPLGCYEESRFASREEMVEQILSVYKTENALV